MARFIIQSMDTGRFLAPTEDGGVDWFRSLRDADAGVITDKDQIGQLLADHCDFDTQAIVIDLDRLGTVNGYART